MSVSSSGVALYDSVLEIYHRAWGLVASGLIKGTDLLEQDKQ